MTCPITGILHDSCLASMKYVYFIKCLATKDQYLLKYGFYNVISTCQRIFTSKFHLVPLILRRQNPSWCTVYRGLLTHQCTKYSKISVLTIAKRLKLIFPDVNGTFISISIYNICIQEKMSCYRSLYFLCLMKNTLKSENIILNLDDCNRSTIYLKS